jgi:hypothetical protein
LARTAINTAQATYDRDVPLVRCPRCLAEDISADAHPSQRLINRQPEPYLVCRNCFRAAELEFRIACEGAAATYTPLPMRDALRLLRDFYREQAADDAAARRALEDVERRLAIATVDS